MPEFNIRWTAADEAWLGLDAEAMKNVLESARQLGARRCETENGRGTGCHLSFTNPENMTENVRSVNFQCDKPSCPDRAYCQIAADGVAYRLHPPR